MIPLSVTIITLNEEHSILRCLESVKPVAAEIVVADSGSTDNTVRICSDFGCRVFRKPFEGYGPQKQFAADQATHEWILSIDADEVATPELIAEIRGLLNREPPMNGYRIPFSLCFMGRLMKHSGVGKEFHLRLFNRKEGRFTTVPVHEGIEISGPCGTLTGRIIHYSYRDISHHLGKINTYTSQAATGYHQRGRKFPKIWVACKFPFSFFSFFILKGGILDGYQGFMWSFLAAFYASLKIAKTIEMTPQK